MGAESRPAQIGHAATPRWGAAVAAWMLMMLAETGHAAVREIFIAPVVGALRARQLGVAIGSLIVLLIAWACSRWIRATSVRSQFIVGGLWSHSRYCSSSWIP